MLTSKQRSQLRALANSLQPIFQIGKGNVSDVQAQQISDALEARELIKITVLKNCDLSVKEACEQMATLTESEQVACIGRRFVLYRPSKDNQRIFLV